MMLGFKWVPYEDTITDVISRRNHVTIENASNNLVVIPNNLETVITFDTKCVLLL